MLDTSDLLRESAPETPARHTDNISIWALEAVHHRVLGQLTHPVGGRSQPCPGVSPMNLKGLKAGQAYVPRAACESSGALAPKSLSLNHLLSVP